MYEAKVLADSISEDGHRLITVQATFPRFILAEVNTHRVFSRNSASSRAIPPEKLIDRVKSDPFIPETFNKRVKGMGVGDEFKEREQEAAVAVWENAAEYAARFAEQLAGLQVDKSRVNRLLEPFLWHTAIISSTEWDNFFALRCPPGEEATTDFPAQLEFQKIAILIRRAMRVSVPKYIAKGEWHLPLVSAKEIRDALLEDKSLDWDCWEYLSQVSAGRCARVSFDTHDSYEDPIASQDRAKRLADNGHLSPFEHPATPETSDRSAGANFTGWIQARENISHQENRVGYLEERKHWDEV